MQSAKKDESVCKNECNTNRLDNEINTRNSQIEAPSQHIIIYLLVPVILMSLTSAGSTHGSTLGSLVSSLNSLIVNAAWRGPLRPTIDTVCSWLAAIASRECWQISVFCNINHTTALPRPTGRRYKQVQRDLRQMGHATSTLRNTEDAREVTVIQ